MRKAITIMIVLALGVSLWADNAQTKPVKGARVSSDRFPLHTSTNDNDRTESYTLVMVDAYGDGWNGGAAVDVLVNGTVVLDDATVPTGYEGATENFDVEVGDAVTTVWTAGTWDSECAYAIYNPAGVLVAQAGTAVHPELEVAFTVSPTHIGVWFSEYAEGSSNNKYLEIYNGTDADVDLTGLAFPNVSNAPTVPGEHEYWNEFPAGATVAPGDVYVIAHGSADSLILLEADHTFTYLSNGDDGFCVVLGAEGNFSILDCIGDWNGDPGDGWDVAGVSEATKDHTLQRKTDVIWGNSGDWVGSAGTTADNSEWIVLENEDWTGLGSHGSSCNLTHDLTVNMVDSYGDGWNGNVLTVGDATFTIESGSEGTGSLCLDDGTFAVTCDGGSYQTEVSWSIVDAAGTVLLEGGAPYDGVLQLGDATEVMGCTDPAAINYDPNATFNDGSCYYQGDSCSIALDFVTAGGTLDGVTP
ncbi:MAG: lamin tail domain-containing protein, partial [Candidatus Marinimicrobia bacterium]|nr:lamin tail domain-containing protein [Candidatus Neomarinimicrobiota bacterium]